MSCIEKARTLAIEAHGKQKYGDMPYVVHLSAVVAELGRMEVEDEEIRAAAWLHDVLEDTTCTAISLLDAGIPLYTVALVDAVTNQPGKNRSQRHLLTYPRIARMRDAVTLKLADRIANVRASLHHARFARMYLLEHQGFKEALLHSGGPPVGWYTLDKLMSTAARNLEGRRS